MTDSERKVWNALRVLGPIFMFGLVLFALSYIAAVPLVLAVVIACLFAIIDYVVLTWLMNRKAN